MAFSIIETGGKQYRVASGQVLTVEKLPKPENGTVTFDKVLLTDDGTKTVVGKPYIEGETVSATFLEEGRGQKILVVKYKAKVRYKKVTGHRQPFTKVKIA